MHHHPRIQSGHIFIALCKYINLLLKSLIRSSFLGGDRILMMKIGLSYSSVPKLTWIIFSTEGGSRYSKRVSHRALRYLIHRSSLDWSNSISLLSSSEWLVETMLIESYLNISTILLSESQDKVLDEWSWKIKSSESDVDVRESETHPMPILVLW